MWKKRGYPDKIKKHVEKVVSPVKLLVKRITCARLEESLLEDHGDEAGQNESSVKVIPENSTQQQNHNQLCKLNQVLSPQKYK